MIFEKNLIINLIRSNDMKQGNVRLKKKYRTHLIDFKDKSSYLTFDTNI